MIIKESHHNIKKVQQELEMKISKDKKEALLEQYLKDVYSNI